GRWRSTRGRRRLCWLHRRRLRWRSGRRLLSVSLDHRRIGQAHRRVIAFENGVGAVRVFALFLVLGLFLRLVGRGPLRGELRLALQLGSVGIPRRHGLQRGLRIRSRDMTAALGQRFVSDDDLLLRFRRGFALRGLGGADQRRVGGRRRGGRRGGGGLVVGVQTQRAECDQEGRGQA